jgi:hypothetical protein
MTAAEKLDAFIREQTNAANLIKRQSLACESNLMLAKWPAYRFLSPLAATKLFVDEFAKAYRQALRVNVDIDRAQNSRVGEKIDFSKPGRWVTAAWSARQEADEIGMPYPEYLNLCFDFLTRLKRRSLPQINQLRIRSDGKTTSWGKALSEFWTPERIDLMLVDMEFIPQYSDPSFQDLPASMGFKDLLLSNAKLYLPYFPHFIGRYVFSKGYISLQDCRDVFGENTVENAVSTLQSDLDRGDFATKRANLSSSDKMMACFGLPGISISTSIPCSECPLTKPCESTRERITTKLIASTGTDDPHRKRELERNRMRVARSRARKKISMS